MVTKLLKRYTIAVLLAIFFDYILIVSINDMIDNNPLFVVIVTYIAVIGFNIGIIWHIVDFIKRNNG